MTFATKNNKCYELDSFDFGRMSRTGIYLLSGKNKQGYRSREISVVIGVADIFMCQYASPDKSNKALPVGTAYAIWTGIGAAGTVLIGIFFFKEPASWSRMFFIFTLICSIVGLKLVSH